MMNTPIPDAIRQAATVAPAAELPDSSATASVGRYQVLRMTPLQRRSRGRRTVGLTADQSSRG